MAAVYLIIFKIAFAFQTAVQQKQRYHNYEVTTTQWFTCAFLLTRNHCKVRRWYNQNTQSSYKELINKRRVQFWR